MDGYLGTIMLVAFDYPPAGWAFCQGQMLSIQQYQALYALVGTRYGGDGASTFALPDLRGRVPVGPGTLGSQTLQLGNKAGAASNPLAGNATGSVTIGVSNLPSHNHTATVQGSSFSATSNSSSNSVATLNASSNTGVPAPSAGAMLGNSTGAGQGLAAIYAPAGGTNYPLAGNSVATTTTTTTTIGGSVNLTTSNTGGGQALPIAVAMNSVSASTVQPSLCMNYIICISGLFPARN